MLTTYRLKGGDKIVATLQPTSFTSFAQAADSIATAQIRNICNASLTAYRNSRVTLFPQTAPMPSLPT